MLLSLLLACVRPNLPGRSFAGELPAPDSPLLESASRIEDTIQVLAGEIGPRSFAANPVALKKAARFIESSWQQQGFVVERQRVAQRGALQTENLWVKVPGHGPPLVVGAHYDTAIGTPGADDNASGVAALLELTRNFRPPTLWEGRELIFIAWTTEEPPYFTSKWMGSAVHAASIGEVHGALSLETIGTYSGERKSQSFPFPLSLVYPARGDFLAFVGNPGSHRFLRQVGGAFREAEDFPSRGGTAPAWITGIDWSDHRSYWAIGAPALMITDTAPFRNPHYHEPTDTPDTVDPVSVARVTRGLLAVVKAQRKGHPNLEPGPVLQALQVTKLRPQRFDTLRGGLLVVKGQGFSNQLGVHIGGRWAPIVEVIDDHTLRVKVGELSPGVHDVVLRGPNGHVELPGAVLLTTGSGPVTAGCSTTVRFETDAAAVDSVAARLLERERFCFSALAGGIEVVGHTDAEGSGAYNEGLGQARAEAVAALLITLGIEADRLDVRTEGEGEGEALTAEERRRVEIRLVR